MAHTRDLSEFPIIYEEGKELGRGRFGTVYEVTNIGEKAIYAAKHVKTRKQDIRDRTRAEIDILQRLQNSKVVFLKEVFEGKMETIIVTEHLSGGELFEKVSSEEFTLTEAEGAHFIRQTCDGVSYIHSQNVVHLDLKPENIMLSSKTSNDIKIVDFGLAKVLKKGEHVQTLCGTPEFVAPEVANFEPIGLESDVWAIGVITYVLLSGLSPFLGDSDTDTYANIIDVDFTFDEVEFDNITETAKNFIASLLIKDRNLRPSSVECLKHPWLRKDQDETKLKKLNTQNLRKFLARRRWQKCGQAIRAMKRFSSSTRFQNISELGADSGRCQDSPESRRTSDTTGYSTTKAIAPRILERKMGVSTAEFSYPPKFRTSVDIVVNKSST